ncbi:MAG TPA: hypothetical protein P5232_02825 [Candidatus Moranbacteria bacterium]|nr:hypothetical protein [Candidatus Moranbacteria bacterium]
MTERVVIQRGYMSLADTIIRNNDLSGTMNIINGDKEIEVFLNGAEHCIRKFKEILTPDWAKWGKQAN